jgi:hypothetical protein
MRKSNRRIRGPVVLCILAVLGSSLSVPLNAGIRAPGKYSGVVIFDRWDGCILFSSVYLMYISQEVKEQLRPYAGKAIELDALEVVQPDNPGDGLIRKLKVRGPAPAGHTPFQVDGIKLNAQLVAAAGSRASIELTVTNEGDKPVEINSAEIGFALSSEKIAGAQTPSDGPSTAVITRTNVFSGKGTWGIGTDDKVLTYSYVVADAQRLPQFFDLAPGTYRSTQIQFEIPPGRYQFFAGYGGGVHESKSIASNPVSLELQ